MLNGMNVSFVESLSNFESECTELDSRADAVPGARVSNLERRAILNAHAHKRVRVLLTISVQDIYSRDTW